MSNFSTRTFLFVAMLSLIAFTSNIWGENTALEFNKGVNNGNMYVKLENIPVVQTYTLEFWLKVASDANAGDMESLIRLGGGDYDRISTLSGAHYLAAGESWKNYISYPGRDDEWHHVAIVVDNTLDSNFVQKIVLDGVEQSIHSYDSHIKTNVTSAWYLASYYAGGGASDLNFNGCMDELRLWDYTRTVAEINADKDKPLTGNESGLIAYWNFDEGSGTALNDKVGSANGVLYNMGDSCWVAGAPLEQPAEPSKSLYFSGSAGDQWVSTAGFKDLVGDADSVYTQEVWIKPDAFEAGWGEQHVMQFYGNYHSQLYLKTSNADSAWLYTQDGNASWNSNLAVVRGEWTHIAYVRDGVSDEAKIYINGQLASTVPLDHDYPTSIDSNLIIGLYNGYTDGSSSYSGLMDELRVWNKALSVDEIRADMVKELNGDEEGLLAYYDFNDQSGDTLKDKTANHLDGVLHNMSASNWNTENTPFTPPVTPGEEGLVALWHFDEGSGSTTADASGNRKDGELKDGAVFDSSGVSGSALSINGEGHVLVPAGGSLDNINKSISIEAWVKPSQIGTKRNIILSEWDGAADQRAYVMYIDTDGKLDIMLSANGAVDAVDIASPTPIEANKWSYVVATSDGDSLRMYINGVEDTVAAAPSSIFVPNTPLYIGDWGWGGVADNTEQYTGLLDEIAMYSYALSADTVLAHYNKYKPTGIRIDKNSIPIKFALMQNYPNPFNPTTTISFELPKQAKVVLSVYNILGEKVVELVNKEMPVGQYKISFDASKFSSGVYFYRISAGEFTSVKKMMLLK